MSWPPGVKGSEFKYNDLPIQIVGATHENYVYLEGRKLDNSEPSGDDIVFKSAFTKKEKGGSVPRF